MEDLTPSQREALSKASTDRLRNRAVRAEGVDEEQVMTMDRPSLQEVVARDMTTKDSADRDAISYRTTVKSEEIMRLELQLEMKRLEAADRRLEREAAERQMEREMQNEREKRDHELKLVQLNRARDEETEDGDDDDENDGHANEAGSNASSRRDRRQPRTEPLANKIKRFGSALKQVVAPMTNDPTEIPQFFDSLENMFKAFEIPDELHAKLLLPFLSSKARVLTTRLTTEELENYAGVKKFLLSEFKLTPQEYKARFDNANKRSDETYTYFAARVRNSLRYYLCSRDCFKDVERLIDLLISDKLKSCFPTPILNYVLAQEGDKWLAPRELGSLADQYAANHSVQEKSRSLAGTHMSGALRSDERGRRAGMNDGQTVSPRRQSNTNITCHKCHGAGHIARNCKWAESKSGRSDSAIKYNTSETARQCFKCGSTQHFARACPQGSRGENNRGQVSVCHAQPSATESRTPPNAVDRSVSTDDAIVANTCVATSVLKHSWEFDHFPNIDALSVNSPNHSTHACNALPVKLSALHIVDITVNSIPCKGLIDSGAELCLLKESLLSCLHSDVCGSIMLQGIIGAAVSAPLVNVVIKLSDGPNTVNIAEGLSAVCGVADINSKQYDVVLTQSIFEELQSVPVAHVMAVNVDYDVNVSDDVCVVSASVNSDDAVENVCDDDDGVAQNVDKLLPEATINGGDELIQAQRDDASLAPCFELAKNKKGNFIIEHDVLYHYDKVEGQTVCQLCVPESKRNAVLKLAHDSVFGGHLAERKTSERIRLSFYWPKLRQSVKHYVTTCTDCQLRSRPKTTDRVPITPITRVDIPFQVLHMDVIGPIDPPSVQGHRYCLCIVDNCTRWPAVYVMKSLTAKAVCDALLDLFVHVGVPSKIISDNGTNFTSQWTQELLRRLGCSPVFVTPGHPQASGLVERFNRTCKDMLHHVIQQHGRQWHRIVPLVVWALREVPNSTTGVSPYMLVYGRVPRGPLAVLGESWANNQHVQADLGKPVEE